MKRKATGFMAAVLAAAMVLVMPLALTKTSVSVEAAVGDTYTVKVDKGYLALRTAMAYDYNNEIGELYTGDTVTLQEMSSSTYWWVYSPKYGRSGYVNKNYLVAPSTPSGSTYTVKVDKGYLALRTAKAYDYRNEIGELYTGDTVTVQNTSDSTYWWVYSPKYNKSGYVNKNYLVASSSGNPSGEAYTVSVATGYLALRTAMAYDYNNEIGELYTGDTVYVQNKSNDTYWWVYSPKHNKYGYVNRNYLLGAGSSGNTSGSVSGPTYTVSVATGYLALRTAKAYDYNNEIGELYTGDKVIVQDSSDATYWWVYSPKYGKYGYVNKNYLY